MNWVEQVIKALLEWLTKLAKTDVVSEDSKPNDALKNHLLDRIAESDRLRESSDIRSTRPTCEACGERSGTCLCSR
jgi:hypothetical protein